MPPPRFFFLIEMHSFDSWRKIGPPLALACCLSAVYWNTIAPGLTWAHDGADGGDLITAAATGGIPHPTGYPFYLLLARMFQYLPVGSPAFRTNVLSAVATVCAAVMVYVLVVRDSGNTSKDHAWLAGLAAGFAFGFAPLIWSQAVITEVYGLHAMLVALILLLYTQPESPSAAEQASLDRWRGLTLGLAAGNHVSTILLLPVALAAGCMQAPPRAGAASWRSWFAEVRFSSSSLKAQLAMCVAGLSLYLLLPLRAMENPPVNWGNVITPERFWWLVSGQLYQSYYLQFNLQDVLDRVQAAASLLLYQFGVPGPVLGLAGLFLFGKPSRLLLLTTWMAVAFTGFAVIYGSDDSYIYLMPAFLAFAVWIGMGMIGLSNRLVTWSAPLRFVLPVLTIGYLLARSVMLVHEMDAGTDLRAESFGREVLSTVPHNAIVFAQGDQAVFALWYYHFAIGERPDLSVVAEDLLHFDWYQENLRATYPSLVVPGPFPWPETILSANPSRAICYVGYADAPQVECSPPAHR